MWIQEVKVVVRRVGNQAVSHTLAKLKCACVCVCVCVCKREREKGTPAVRERINSSC